jgi:hypothetical protein
MKPECLQPGSPDYPPAWLRGGASWIPPVIHVSAVPLAREEVKTQFERKPTKVTKGPEFFVPFCELPVLAQHYGFTDEELDFILNYDIKYRLGLDSGEEE